MPLECEPTRMPSSSRKCVQVSTAARSPMPTRLIPVTSSSTSSRLDCLVSAAALRLVASPTARGASITPSEPRSSTPKTIVASSTSATSVMTLPSALSAAASAISSGILVGSRNHSTLQRSRCAASQAIWRVSGPTTSTKRPNSTSGCVAWYLTGSPNLAESRITTSAPERSSGSSPSEMNRTLVVVGGSVARSARSSETIASTRWWTASSMIAALESPVSRTSSQQSLVSFTSSSLSCSVVCGRSSVVGRLWSVVYGRSSTVGCSASRRLLQLVAQGGQGVAVEQRGDLARERAGVPRLEDVAAHRDAGGAGLDRLAHVGQDGVGAVQPRPARDHQRDRTAPHDVGHLADGADVRRLHDVRAEIGGQRGGVGDQRGVARVGDPRSPRVHHGQQGHVPPVARVRDRGEVGDLLLLAVGPEVHVHAHRVGTQAQGVLDAGDQVLRVGVGRVRGARAQVDDQRGAGEPPVVEVAEAPLVQHHRVDMAVGELTDEADQATIYDDGTGGHRVVQRHDQEPLVAVAVQPLKTELLAEGLVAWHPCLPSRVMRWPWSWRPGRPVRARTR